MMRLRASVPLLAVLLLAFGACGDDERDPAAEQTLAEQALVTSADLPDGYERDPDEDEDADDSDPLDECLGGDRDELTEAITAEAESPNYQRQTDSAIELVGSASAVFDDEDQAEEAVDLFDSDEARECLNTSLEEELAGGDTGAEITSAGVEPYDFPEVGDQTSGIRMALRFSAEGQEYPFTMDLAFVRSGRVVTLLFFGRLGEPYDADVAHGIAEKVVARL